MSWKLNQSQANFKKTKTIRNSVSLLRIVLVFLKQTLCGASGTLFKNVHCQGLCSLRPCISRLYCRSVWAFFGQLWPLLQRSKAEELRIYWRRFFAVTTRILRRTSYSTYSKNTPDHVRKILTSIWLSWMYITKAEKLFGYKIGYRYIQ